MSGFTPVSRQLKIATNCNALLGFSSQLIGNEALKETDQNCQQSQRNIEQTKGPSEMQYDLEGPFKPTGCALHPQNGFELGLD